MNPIYNENLFFNINESTTDDEIIDIALKKLYKTNQSEYLFSEHNQFLDEFRVLRIVNTMKAYSLAYEHGQIFGSHNIPLVITQNGNVISKNGGWLNHLQTIKQDEQKNLNQKNQINIIGNITDSQIIQDSLSGNLEFQIIEKKYPNNPATTTQKESTISKIFKFTNHQVIGGIIIILLSIFITWIFKNLT